MSHPIQPEERGLGDLVALALSAVHITPELVEEWLGAPCGCRERQEKFNQLGAWAKRIAKGKLDHAKEFLDGILGRK